MEKKRHSCYKGLSGPPLCLGGYNRGTKGKSGETPNGNAESLQLRISGATKR